MTQRAIRRAQQRLAAKARRRAALAAGAAIGATALFAPAAQAENLTVTTTSDAGDGVCDATCTLREAITRANGNGEDDTITFASGVTGTIDLAAGGGSLNVGGDGATIAIQGPGPDDLSVSGGDTVGIFDVGGLTRFDVSGLTLEHGNASRGAAIYSPGVAVNVSDSVIDHSSAASYGGAIATRRSLNVVRSELTNNGASYRGGAIDFRPSPYGEPATLSVVDSTISGNTVVDGSGGGIFSSGDVGIDGSEVSGNTVTYGNGGGIDAHGPLSVTASTISGNKAPVGAGGGLTVGGGKYTPLDVIGSEISGNSADTGGGIGMSRSTYGARSAISESRIADNQASSTGAGVYATVERESDRLTIARSTVSGNDAGPGNGGGIRVAREVRGDIDVTNSTVSGNKAGTGAGASVDAVAQVGDPGRIAFANSTIASNTASVRGGGIYLHGGGSDDTSPDVKLESTIVGDNTPADLDRSDNALNGIFRFAFSLIENTGNAPFVQSSDAPSILGQDPQLGPLADNGGPTLTHLPAATSPAIERGLGDPDTTDQRGHARVEDGDGANAANGDGADIGAVEIDNPRTPPKPPDNPPPENPPPQNPPAQNPPAQNPPAQTTPQDLPPQALIRHNGLRSKNPTKRFVSGIANDDHAVVAVDVAIVRKRGNKCRQLLPGGKFSKSMRCHGPKVFQPAEGTTKWRFDLGESLDPGYYVVYSRAVDDSGRKQVSFGTKSRRPFRVR